MKRSLIALAAIMSFAACNRQADPVNTAIIKGVVSPHTVDYLAFTLADFLDSAKIEEDGSFELTVPLKKAGYGILMFNNSLVDLFIEPGKNLEVNINSNTFPEKIDFKGELGPVNHYLQLSRKLEKQADIGTAKLYSMEPDGFLRFTDSIRQINNQLLGEYILKYPEMDSAFLMKRKADILYTWANQQLLYPGYYTILRNLIPPIAGDYHQKYLEQVDLHNPALLVSPMYTTFLENYLDYREAVYLGNHPELEKLWFPGSVARFRVIHEEFSDQQVKNYLLARAMNDHLDNFGSEHIETFITNFRVTCTNEEYMAQVEEKLKRSESLGRGQEAPDLEFFNLDGDRVKLSELKGTLLYINFWASWSELSLQEFPYWEALRKKFEGYSIQFVSVSMDYARDRNKWEYIVEKQNLGGLQLMQDPQSKAFTDKYFISDLPRYFLIDKEGKIISVHAPHPSENVELVLQKLIRE